MKFVCKKCSEFACFSDEIRCIHGKHRAVVSKEFSDKYDVVEHRKKSEPKDVNGVVIYKTIVCAKCKSYWGSYATYDDKNLPFLSVKSKSFILKGENRNLTPSETMLKKWSEAWFIIDDYDQAC